MTVKKKNFLYNLISWHILGDKLTLRSKFSIKINHTLKFAPNQLFECEKFIFKLLRFLSNFVFESDIIRLFSQLLGIFHFSSFRNDQVPLSKARLFI